MSPPDHVAVLFAGGHSRRMGTDKARLPHPRSGRPLLLHQLDTLRAAGCVHLWLAVRPDQAHPDVPAEIRRLFDSGVDGPLPALATVLETAATLGIPRVLALAVDLPDLPPARLVALLAAATPACGVVPRQAESGLEPLCAIYPTRPDACAAFAAARQAGRLALHPVLNAACAAGWMRPWPIPAEAKAEFANWNTPADLTAPT